jgi:hypothetical protein
MNRCHQASLRVLAGRLAASLLLFLSGGAPAQPYDGAAVADLSAMLPESVLRSGQHRLLGARPDGPYRMVFEIEAESLGSYSVRGLPLTMQRVQEIQVLAQALSQYRSDNQLEANEDRGKIRIGGDSVVDILGAPLSTGSEVVSQFGRNVDQTLDELGAFPGPGEADPARGGRLPADDPILASHRRSVAGQLRLDVYSSNAQLQRFLHAVARARMNGLPRAGITTVSLGPGSQWQVAGGAIRSRALNAVLNADSDPLQERNGDLLRAAGVPDADIERLRQVTAMTPSHRTLLTEYLRFMDGVAHREALVRALFSARDEVEVMDSLQIARMYAYHHEASKPLARFISSGRLPLALTEDGKLLVALPFDRLAWDREAEKVFTQLAKFAQRKDISKRQVLVNGLATARARQALAVLGFGTVQRYLFIR